MAIFGKLVIGIITGSILLSGDFVNSSVQADSGIACGKVVLVGHRGTGPGANENTIGAFRQAVKNNVDSIELDVRKTKDDKLVIMHDGTINRTTNKSGSVSNMNWSKFNTLRTQNGSRAPSFGSAVFSLKNSGVDLHVDLKYSASDDEIMSMWKILQRNGFTKKTVQFNSGSYKALANVKDLTGAQTAYIWKGGAGVELLDKLEENNVDVVMYKTSMAASNRWMISAAKKRDIEVNLRGNNVTAKQAAKLGAHRILVDDWSQKTCQ